MLTKISIGFIYLGYCMLSGYYIVMWTNSMGCSLVLAVFNGFLGYFIARELFKNE